MSKPRLSLPIRLRIILVALAVSYARGQAENLIKLHKTQLQSDRTSCTSALANPARRHRSPGSV